MNHVLGISCDSKFFDKYYKNQNNYTTDCGFDLYCPEDMTIHPNSFSNKIKLGIKCRMDYNDTGYSIGYKLYPRSSMGSKTPLRLSNSIGVVDPEYRGDLIAVVDNFSNKEYIIKKGDRLVQAVAFDGNPIKCEFVDSIDYTDRGSGGFGSTGK